MGGEEERIWEELGEGNQDQDILYGNSFQLKIFASKIKDLGKYPIKDVKDFYNRDFKMLKKEITEDSR